MKVGTDPEFFIRDGRRNPVPAHRFFNSKDEKHSFGKDVKVFRDGYPVEINVTPCAGSIEGPIALGYKVKHGLQAIITMLPRSYTLSLEPAVEIDLVDDMKDAPEDVKHFGCEPSYDAYEAKEKCCRIEAMKHKYRYAGGHMHFSADAEELAGKFAWLTDKNNHLTFIKMLDYWVGVPLTYIFESKNQYRRRKVYGQAGEFRPQEYPDGSLGLEYRTPSPHLWSNFEVAQQMFRAGLSVFEHFELYRRAWKPALEPVIRRAINTGIGLKTLVAEEPLFVRDKWDTAGFKAFRLPDEI